MEGSSGEDVKCLKLRKEDSLVRGKWRLDVLRRIVMTVEVNVSDCFWHWLIRVIPN